MGLPYRLPHPTAMLLPTLPCLSSTRFYILTPGHTHQGKFCLFLSDLILHFTPSRHHGVQGGGPELT